MSVSRPCDFCQTTYEAELRYLNRGQGQYCSRSCSAKDAAQKRLSQRESNVICAYCNEPFYLSPSKKKKSKSGLFFCIRAHKDLAQRLEQGYEEYKTIHPAHYGSGMASSNYRKTARRYLDMTKCSKCSYNKYPEILQINHIDCDRSNNHLLNLEVLCPNCHMEYHFTTKTGPWGTRSK